MALRFLAVACAALLGACAAESPAATPVAATGKPAAVVSPERVASSTPAPEPPPAPAPAPKPNPPSKPEPAKTPSQPPKPRAKPPPATPKPESVSTPKPERAAAKPPPPAPLDLASLEERLKDTSAIGLLTKLSLKNQVDDLVGEFRAYHRGVRPPTLAQLRPAFELLLMKVLSLLQDRDPALAHDVSASREAIWAVLTDPRKLAKFS
jgi:hypothetical protein